MLDSKPMRAIPLRSWALAACSALLQVLPFPIAGPAPLWRRLFCWFCIAPLLHAILGGVDQEKALTPKQSALVGYLCGVLWYLGNCYWIYQTMYLYGGIPKPGAIGIVVLFAMYLGLYLALFGWVLGAWRERFSRQAALWLAPFLWVAVELARARVTGFPWDLLGYTQVDNIPLASLTTVTGVMGPSLIVAAVNTLWLVKPPSHKWKYAGPAAPITIVLVAVVLQLRGASVPPAPHDSTAVLLQENLSVGAEAQGRTETKEQMLSSFTAYSMLSALRKPQVVIWPEAPADFLDADPVFRAALGSVARQTGAPVIADSVSIAGRTPEGPAQLYNSASFFAPDGDHAGRYDKMHLVPFGEYTPYKQFFFFAGHLLDNVGPFVPGTARQVFTSGNHRYGVFICYESIFSDEIRQFPDLGADVLVNISDDGWYGDTSAPWEHLDMARMRAIENGRWLLRATNTGLTGSIDPQGRIVAQMPRHQRGAISVPFAYRTDTTFYTRHGDWLAWLCTTVSLGALLLSFKPAKGR